ncbi:hypothetical protein [Endozoicomonas sp. ALB032]|uniref:hypothetical protein n=1 Tax=Endozoicomonas sp. ALB032 TaxID=3403082 RepID=UPI003BB5B86C
MVRDSSIGKIEKTFILLPANLKADGRTVCVSQTGVLLGGDKHRIKDRIKDMEIKDTHLTIVYTVNDQKAFEAEKARIRNYFESPDGKPWAITAWSIDHEIKRLGLIEEALEKDRVDLAKRIIKAINLCDYETLADFDLDIDAD